MLSEKKFRVIMIVLTVFTLIIVTFSIKRYYDKLPSLDTQQQSVTKEKEGKFPILPFDVFSITKDELKLTLGEPNEEGTGEDYSQKYLDYKQNWFGQDVIARYFYGDYDRMYQIVIECDIKDGKKIFANMKKDLGKPDQDEYTSENEYSDATAYWVEDSVRHTITDYPAEDLTVVTMNLQYYVNSEELELGDRPIIIDMASQVQFTKDGPKGKLYLVGDKAEYTTKTFEKLFLVFNTEEKSYVGRFKEGNDGGLYPKLKLKEDKSTGKKVATVKATNEYTTYYTDFEFNKEDGLHLTYSGENPQGNGSEKKDIKEEK